MCARVAPKTKSTQTNAVEIHTKRDSEIRLNYITVKNSEAIYIDTLKMNSVSITNI